MIASSARRVVQGRDRQRGETLIELMATVALLAIGISGIVGGLAAVQKVTTLNRESTQSSLEVQSYAEQLKLPDLPNASNPSYVSCATPATYSVPPYSYSGQVPGTTFIAKVVAVEYLTFSFTTPFPTHDTDPAPVAGVGVTTLCGGTVDTGVQRITIDVYDPSNDTATVDLSKAPKEQVVIIKRNQACPSSAAYPNPDQGPC